MGGGPGGGTQQMFMRGGSGPTGYVQPITLLYTIFHEKGTVYLFFISSIDKWYSVIHTLFRTLHPFQLL